MLNKEELEKYILSSLMNDQYLTNVFDEVIDLLRPELFTLN